MKWSLFLLPLGGWHAHGDEFPFSHSDAFLLPQEYANEHANEHANEQEHGVTAIRWLQQEDDQGLVVDSCLDATELFRTAWDRRFNGRNILTELFDCQCQGDLAMDFTLNCTRSNFCINATTPIGQVDYEVCIAKDERIYDMQINRQSGFLEGYQRLSHCYEFASGGPTSGKLCNEFNPNCVFRLRDEFGQSTPAASAVCESGDSCRPILQELGISRRDATDLCFNRTLDGQRCKTWTGDPLRQSCDALGETSLLSFDCSNVEDCVTPSCQSFDPSDFFSGIQFPTCAGVETVPGEVLPTNHILSCSNDPDDTETKFDQCVYGDGGFSQEQARVCRECVVSASFESFNFGALNCAENVEQTCSSLRSCVFVRCGDCAQEAYDLLACMAQDIPGLSACEVDCTKSPSRSPTSGVVQIPPKFGCKRHAVLASTIAVLAMFLQVLP